MKYTYILVSALIVLVLSSCGKDELDLAPISAVGSNGFYTTDDELDQATIAIYDALQAVPLREFAVTEMRSDNTGTRNGEGDWGQFDRFDVLPTNQAVLLYWQRNYNVIFKANRVLENLNVVANPTLKNQLDGEAKFSRALAHFNLVRAFGDVPILDKEINFTDEEYFSRDPSSEVYDFIISDLLSAIGTLPTQDNMVFGRATVGAAQALLAKVYLTVGNYSGAQALCEDVINSGTYSLMSDYRDIFYNEENAEVIFAIRYINDDELDSQDFSAEMQTATGRTAGLNFITSDFIANYDANETIRNTVIQNIANGNNSPNECGKYLSNSSAALFAGNDWIVLRLADVYLMHTEAIMEGRDATQNIPAIESFNMVRNRAGLDPIATDGSGEITVDMLLHERRYELACENHRLYDLVRLGQAQPVLAAFAAQGGYIFTSTDLLLPIPQAEVNVSKGKLIQNPGY